MQLLNKNIVFSASDLANFLECEHLTTFDLIEKLQPEVELKRSSISEEAILVQTKGQEHESSYLNELRLQDLQIEDFGHLFGNLDAAVNATHDAMQRGVDVIYQAALQSGQFSGYADFLRKVPGKSKLGDWHYEAIDTKLAKSPKAKFLIQLCFYSELLAGIQGTIPAMVYVVSGDGIEHSFRTADYQHYFSSVKHRFLAHIENNGEGTYPHPIKHCNLCHWSETCEKQRQDDDHLCQVANITHNQIRKLNDAGVSTLAKLAEIPQDMPITGISSNPLARIRHQAILQKKKKDFKDNFVDLLPQEANRGFALLPKPNNGDMFFDMEGDPYIEGGLEYLFGVGFIENGEFNFKPFWGHSRSEERKAFEDFIDWVSARLKVFPDAHIYHYADYEETALKRLMSQHGTREQQVDNLLRQHKLVDLYEVVRQGLMVSEPRYSIKNLECFYTEKREGEVKSAGASIVWYERYMNTKDEALLEDIRAYNEDDCRSTWQLLNWLIPLRPDSLTWANPNQEKDKEEPTADSPNDLLLKKYREALIGDVPEDHKLWHSEQRLRELTYQVMDYHRREAKPQWWAYYKRMTMNESELIEDGECIGGLQRDISRPPRTSPTNTGSLIHTYSFPEQQFKIKTGDKVVNVETGKNLNLISIDEDNLRIELRLSKKLSLPDSFSIGPGEPLTTEILRDANRRFADSMINDIHNFSAIENLLRCQPPKIKGKLSTDNIIDESKEMLPQIIDAVDRLDNSYLFIQGPPGAGKTYSGSRVIVEMLRNGKRVAIASNSHHAINNLLTAVEKVADEQKFTFHGAKKSNKDADGSLFKGRYIRDVYDKKEIINEDKLVAGTAWLFADQAFDQAFDILFVDEAGQVALASLIAMGTCAKNIVLLGDPMQLGQPTQGSHPGRSGESGLEYLLDGRSTVPPDMGVFLATSWRMAPDVCKFISDAVYDGRLTPESHNANQHLKLNKNADPILRQTGIRFLECEHDGCGQKSLEEAERIKGIYNNLLTQSYVDRKGEEHPITKDDILVVAP